MIKFFRRPIHSKINIAAIISGTLLAAGIYQSGAMANFESLKKPDQKIVLSYDKRQDFMH